MRRLFWCWMGLAALVCTGSEARGQSVAQTPTTQAVQSLVGTVSTAEGVAEQPVPLVPGLSSVWRGFNAGATFSQVHDSAAGWYNLFTPAISYSFSRHYSADASVSIYPYRRVEVDEGATTYFKSEHGEVGDVIIGLHGAFGNKNWRSTTTVLGTAPTGDRSEGLGAGKFTYDLSDRIERYFEAGSLLVDLGGGDTSGLFNRQVTQDQTSVGTVVHFAAGGVLYLPRSWYLQPVAYELMPIGRQTVYATVNPPGAPAAPIFMGSGISEENGIVTTLGVPLSNHFTLWSYYNRSFRQGTDTVSMGITYVLRPPARHKRLSMIDRALREAESP